MPSALIGRSGEDVETVVSMLLCRRHEHAARRRPARGDRGIDVYVPVDDGRIDVYQVKKFHQSLTTGQWAQVRKSVDELAKAVREGHVTVRNWYLTMPLDATDDDEAKLADLVRDAPFEHSEWHGAARLLALESEFPDVIDYYLKDGKERLAQSQRDLMTVLGVRQDRPGGPGAGRGGSGRSGDGSEGPGSGALAAGLAALYRELNRYDPHYRYEYAVGDADNWDAAIPQVAPAGLVFTEQVVVDSDVCVTWHVYARCDESVRERPIPLNVQVNLDAAQGLREAVEAFADYGQPFVAKDGAATITADLPGGFGGRMERGSVRFMPTQEAAAAGYTTRLRVTPARPFGPYTAGLGNDQGVGRADAAGQAVTVRVAMAAPTAGRRGTRASGEHDGGAFTVELFHDFDPWAGRVRFAELPLAGKPVGAVLPGVEFLAALPGGRLEVAAEHGPFLLMDEHVPAGAGPRDGDDERAELIMEALRALWVLQEHTSNTVLVPEEITSLDVQDWQMVGRVLHGETVPDPRIGVLTMPRTTEASQLLGQAMRLALNQQLVVDLRTQTLMLGRVHLILDKGTLDAHPIDADLVTVTPAAGHQWTRRLAAGEGPPTDT